VKRAVAPFARYIGTALSEGTAGKYAAAAEKFLTWAELQGWNTWEDLPRTAIRDYCAGLVEAQYRAASVQAHIAGILRFVKWARQQDYELRDFYDPEIPRNHRKVRDTLSSDMFEHYFRLADEREEPVRTAAMLLPCAGLRGSELVSLPLTALRRVTLKLSDGSKKETMTLMVKGKGGDERVVPLLDEGAQVVAGYMAKGGWRDAHPDPHWLFPGRHGHLAARTLRSAVQHIREPLKMRFTPHTMRRTYLTTLYRKGVDPLTLAKIAGHKDVKTLMVHYLALDEFDLAGAVHNTGGRLTA
jgi:site-specific recombinase XerD